MQCTTWCWHRNQSRVESLSQYVIFKLEELEDKHLLVYVWAYRQRQREGEKTVFKKKEMCLFPASETSLSTATWRTILLFCSTK